MKETNQKIIITLIIIILLLCILFVLALTGEIRITPKEENTNLKVTEHEKNIEKTSYTYEELKGLYSFEESEKRDSDGFNESKSYDLYLYENGTFDYRVSTSTADGRIGNYIIIDNTLKLNCFYSYNLGVGLTYKEGTSTLIINKDGTLTETKNLITEKNITLEKNNNTETAKNFEERNVNDLMKTNEEYLKNK